jgi:hypothetical protein
MKPQHSPTPWKINPTFAFEIIDEKGTLIALTYARINKKKTGKENAQYIVKCVNAYDDLIQLLSEALVYVEDQLDCPCTKKGVVKNLANKIRKAINESN